MTVHQIRILNGRMFGDCFGNYTCFTPNGASVVDYTIVSENVLSSILYFYVHEFNPLMSDCHSLLEWQMSANFILQPIQDIPKYLLQPRFLWTVDSAEKFCLALSSPEINSRLDSFVRDIVIEDSQSSIDTACADLTDIILSAANLSLKQKKNPIYV